MTLLTNPNHTAMSRQEILSWTSLATSLSVLFFYIFFVFGWPDTVPDLSAGFTKIFFNVFWIALAIELIIGLTESKAKVLKDERDEKIEAIGHKYAYGFFYVQYYCHSVSNSALKSFWQRGRCLFIAG